MTAPPGAWYHAGMEAKLHPVLTIRLFAEEKCFGPGVASLLDGVEEQHSLRAAAAAMGMAYSKAWTIIRRAEDQLGFKLLLSTTGGKHGGGAALTAEASELLAAYRAYCAALHDSAETLFAQYFPSFL